MTDDADAAAARALLRQRLAERRAYTTRWGLLCAVGLLVAVALIFTGPERDEEDGESPREIATLVLFLVSGIPLVMLATSTVPFLGTAKRCLDAPATRGTGASHSGHKKLWFDIQLPDKPLVRGIGRGFRSKELWDGEAPITTFGELAPGGSCIVVGGLPGEDPAVLAVTGLRAR